MLPMKNKVSFTLTISIAFIQPVLSKDFSTKYQFSAHFSLTMAETFLFNIAEKLAGKLGAIILQEVLLGWGVESELEKLASTLSSIRAVLLDAEEKQENNHQLIDWLGKIKDALYDADDVLDECQYEALRSHGGIKGKVRNFFSSSNPVAFRLKMGNRINGVVEKLDQIAAEKSKFHLTEQHIDTRVVHGRREMTHSFVNASDVIGRDDDKEYVVQHLMLPAEVGNVPVIPIVGFGGLGKTTLAKFVYNDERVVKHFDLRMWVCVSNDFDVTKLTKEILNSTTDRNFDNLTIDQVQINLRKTLDKKKFLLVLDDVWNEDRDKWIRLRDLLLGGAGGSKIIVTTRSQSIASIMGTIPSCKLEGLPYEYCLSLFVKLAFREGEDKQYPNLIKIGKEIVTKCGGVPLAVRTLGSLLYLKRNVREWLHVKDNEIWKLEQKEDDILPALRLSYNQMPSYLKQCFAFWSIFPKDYVIEQIDLIQLWMAQGLLQSPSSENQELEDIGERCVDELRSRSFLEDAGSRDDYIQLKMHDLVHDLALSVAQTEYRTINSSTPNISKRVRHVSIFEKDLSLDEVSRFLLNRNNLRTMIVPFGLGVLDELTGKSFVKICVSRFKSLKVLDLSNSFLEVLPNSISELKHLRHLDLSRNNRIKRLPNSICKLQNLLSLKIHRCGGFEELPADIGNLINLRLLYITTKQMILPDGIRRLVSLRYLGITCCHNLISIGEEMQCLTSLRLLFIFECENLEALPRNMKYLTSLDTLHTYYCTKLGSMEWVENIQVLTLRLRWFWVRGQQNFVALPQWLQWAADTIEYIYIRECYNFTTLPDCLQNLTSLQILEIIDCPGLLALPEGLQHLTALRRVTMTGCSFELRARCAQQTGEDWPKIAHVSDINLDEDIYSELSWQSHSQPDDTPFLKAENERLQQEVARLEEKNRLLQDMVSGRSMSRDKAGPSRTFSVP